MGSYSRWIPEDKGRIVKTILKEGFDNRKMATKYEADIITKDIKHPLNRNYHIPPDKFYGGPKGPRKKYHPFATNKYMKQWCKEHGIKCNTKNGSDIDWTPQKAVRPFRSIPITISKTEYVMGMSRPKGY